ncbi:MAG: type II toxin-antitoxin system RelE/ParE family toxin [Elusimicrobia bacterium]|nr:type II toxin-antitoxin system RelE/ParE family toxin [Elusimicrobiota bacterium]
MKRREVVYLARARRDLLEIRDYIKKDAPGRAVAWVERMDKALGRLADYPESGTVPRDERLAAKGYRVVVIGEYLAFYLPHKGRVEVRRVVHGKRRYGFIV